MGGGLGISVLCRLYWIMESPCLCCIEHGLPKWV